MLLPLYDKNPHSRWPLLTALLIALNVGCFCWSIADGPHGFVETVYRHGFVPQRLEQLDQPQPVVVEVDDPVDNREPPRELELSTDSVTVYGTMFSMMFLHGGFLHLISNMWMLWVFGDNVEDRLGRLVYLFFYLVAGLAAVLAQWLSDPGSVQPVIGASGAVAGVLGAYAVTFPTAKVKTFIFVGLPLIIDLPSALVLGIWLLLNLVGVIQMLQINQGPEVGIAYWAHIGGFLAGVILMPALTAGAQPTDKDWRTETRELFDI